jgi:hypothetical protein
MSRPSDRTAAQLRPVTITRHFTKHAEGSVLVEFGNTKVLCTASVEEKVPPHQKGSGEGWVTGGGVFDRVPGTPEGCGLDACWLCWVVSLRTAPCLS